MRRNLLIGSAAALALAACTDRTPTPSGLVPEGARFQVNLKGGAHAKPSHTDLVLQLESAGAYSGLGNGDVFVRLTATANATATCTNPGSGVHQPAGQNPAPVTVSGGQAIPGPEIKNGTTPFDVLTAAPVTPIAGAPGCPNSQWIEDITDLAFTTGTLTVQQPQDLEHPDANIVFTMLCTFAPATANGAVPSYQVSCQ